MTVSYLIGKRVQIPVWTDTWMMGDRYGVIVKVARQNARVRLDKSGRTKQFRVADLEVL